MTDLRSGLMFSVLVACGSDIDTVDGGGGSVPRPEAGPAPARLGPPTAAPRRGTRSAAGSTIAS